MGLMRRIHRLERSSWRPSSRWPLSERYHPPGRSRLDGWLRQRPCGARCLRAPNRGRLTLHPHDDPGAGTNADVSDPPGQRHPDVWTLDHLLKTVADAEAYLRLPEPTTGNVDVSASSPKRRSSGCRHRQHRIRRPDLLGGRPVLDGGLHRHCPDRASALPPAAGTLARALFPQCEQVARACPGRLWRICGRSTPVSPSCRPPVRGVRGALHGAHGPHDPEARRLSPHPFARQAPGYPSLIAR